jgi:hypothetical protein
VSQRTWVGGNEVEIRFEADNLRKRLHGRRRQERQVTFGGQVHSREKMSQEATATATKTRTHMRLGRACLGQREAKVVGDKRDTGEGSDEAAVRDSRGAPRREGRSEARVTNWGTGSTGRW